MLEVKQEHPCSYLSERTAKTRYRLAADCSAEEYEWMLERGWRRFGQTFFRPECVGCSECQSLRVEVAKFQPNRSMRRTKRKNKDLQALMQPVSLTAEHLALYERYHDDMSVRRQWKETDVSPNDYFQTFVEGGHEFGHEVLYFDGERLVCVALVDVLPNSMSAVYCYYDPELRSRALGVYSVLVQLELARHHGIEKLYLGYWVEGNASMRYKSSYRPHEILRGRPEHADSTDWRPPPAVNELAEGQAERADQLKGIE